MWYFCRSGLIFHRKRGSLFEAAIFNFIDNHQYSLYCEKVHK